MSQTTATGTLDLTGTRTAHGLAHHDDQHRHRPDHEPRCSWTGTSRTSPAAGPHRPRAGTRTRLRAYEPVLIGPGRFTGCRTSPVPGPHRPLDGHGHLDGHEPVLRPRAGPTATSRCSRAPGRPTGSRAGAYGPTGWLTGTSRSTGCWTVGGSGSGRPQRAVRPTPLDLPSTGVTRLEVVEAGAGAPAESP